MFLRDESKVWLKFSWTETVVSSGRTWYLWKGRRISRAEKDQNIMQKKLGYFQVQRSLQSATTNCSVRKSEKMLMKSSAIGWGLSLKESWRQRSLESCCIILVSKMKTGFSHVSERKMQRKQNKALFSDAQWQDKSRSKLEPRRFLNSRTHFFAVTVTKKWHRFPEMWWSLHSCRCLEAVWTQSRATPPNSLSMSLCENIQPGERQMAVLSNKAFPAKSGNYYCSQKGCSQIRVGCGRLCGHQKAVRFWNGFSADVMGKKRSSGIQEGFCQHVRRGWSLACQRGQGIWPRYCKCKPMFLNCPEGQIHLLGYFAKPEASERVPVYQQAVLYILSLSRL